MTYIQIHAILIIFLQLQGWELLSTVTWNRAFDEMLGQESELPIFSEQLYEMEGKKVTISGYVIPLEAGAEQQYFVLSRFPYQSCFFCGAAGPETVVEIYPTLPRDDLKPDQKITVTGKLFLNPSDPLHLSFIIKEANLAFD